jgi:hypothetical protein
LRTPMTMHSKKEEDRLRFGGTTYLGYFDGMSAFEKIHDGFREALRSCQGLYREFYYTFAGRLVRFRIIGKKLAEIIELPFRHLCAGLGSPSLTIDLWDQDETGVSCPLSTSEGDMPRSEPDVEYCFVKSSADGRFVCSERPQMMTLFDRTAEHLVGSVSSGESLSFFECGKPLQFPLLVWHHDRGAPVIHAALVSRDERGVLFAGKGGSGKTTGALSCLLAGFDYLGDDYISLESLPDGSFAGHSLYGSTWIMAGHSERFPFLTPYLIKPPRPDREKSLVHLSPVFPKRLARAARIRVIVLPVVGDGLASRVRPASKKEALLALAPSSIILLPSSGSHALGRLSQLVDRVPGYWLEVGENLEDIPQRVEEILRRAS